MSLAGELDIRAMRQSAPGANQQLVLNTGGVVGTSPNLSFDYGNSNVNVVGNINTLNVTIAISTSNVPNGFFTMTYNVSSNSLDFLWG